MAASLIKLDRSEPEPRHNPEAVAGRGLMVLGGLLVGAGLLLWLPESLEDASTPRTDLGAALVGGAVVALAVLFAEQMFARALERRSLAESFATSLHDPVLEHAETAAAAFFALGQRTADDAWKEWCEFDAERQRELLRFPNFLESVATAYCSNRADRAVVRASFELVAEHHWERSEWFVLRLREEFGHPGIYEKWERMTTEFEITAPRSLQRP